MTSATISTSLGNRQLTFNIPLTPMSSSSAYDRVEHQNSSRGFSSNPWSPITESLQELFRQCTSVITLLETAKGCKETLRACLKDSQQRKRNLKELSNQANLTAIQALIKLQKGSQDFNESYTINPADPELGSRIHPLNAHLYHFPEITS